MEYADYFGIDAEREPHLLWIAEEVRRCAPSPLGGPALTLRACEPVR